MWFIGVELEQEASAPLPKKILDPPLKVNRSKYNVRPKRLVKQVSFIYVNLVKVSGS